MRVQPTELHIQLKHKNMATTNLTFTKQGDEWVSTFTATGAGIVEIERKKQGNCSVFANISGMNAVPIASFQNPYVKNVIFNLDIPAGIEVTIKSATEVTAAKMFTE